MASRTHCSTTAHPWWEWLWLSVIRGRHTYIVYMKKTNSSIKNMLSERGNLVSVPEYASAKSKIVALLCPLATPGTIP